MKVSTYDSVISKEEVEALIKLTGERYESLNLDVRVFGTKERAEEHIRKTLSGIWTEDFVDEYLYEVLFKDVGASHIQCNAAPDDWTDCIFIYEFNSRLETCKIVTAHNLFHELRHAYQYAYWDRAVISKTKAESTHYKVPYRQQPIEVDANYYACTMMNFYYLNIRTILGTTIYWNPLPEEEMSVLKKLQKLYPEFYEDTLASAGAVPPLFEEDLVATAK